MLTKPWPRRATDEAVEAGTVVADLEVQRAARPPRRDTATVAVAPACLPAFCSASRQQKYTAASMLAAVATDARRRRPSSPARALGSRPPAAPRRARRRRAVAGRCRAQASAARRSPPARRARSRRSSPGVRGVVRDGVLGETQLDGERDEVLLRAVVQVALELAPLGVAGRDDAGARVLQLLVASAAARRGSPAGRRRAAGCAGPGRPAGPAR